MLIPLKQRPSAFSLIPRANPVIVLSLVLVSWKTKDELDGRTSRVLGLTVVTVSSVPQNGFSLGWGGNIVLCLGIHKRHRAQATQ